MTPEEFQQSFMPYAQGVSQRTGLDPRMVLAQAALETGWGRSAPNNNFFGIKSHGQSGGSNLMTQEFQDGRMVSMPQSFRGYESPEQSFQGYADFILDNPRYGDVMAQGDLAGQIGAMGQSGYATDPDYASKLASIARRFGGDIPAGQQPTISTRTAPDTPQAVGRDTRSALGLLQNEGNQMAQQPQRPQGLLGSLGVQRRDPNAQGETSQPFYNRQSFGDTLARMAPALGRMGVMGLEGPMQAQLDTRNQRQGDERAQQAQAQQRNATAEWFRSQGGDEWADAVLSGALTGAQALSGFQAANAPAATSASFTGLDAQAQAAGLQPGTPEYQEFMLNGGGAPANLRALQMQAMEAGFEPGTPEYQEFMATRGSGLSAAAARTGTLTSDIELGGQARATEDIAAASVQFGVAAYESYGKLQTSLGNIDEAIRAIDGGAKSGLVYNMLPSITEASASLENSMNRMGLDVIGSVTFGALSEGEMRLAMSTAVPQNLAPAELRAWLVRRRDAQAKAAATMQNAAEFLTTPGPNQTIDAWIARNKAANEGGATSAPPAGGGNTADMSDEDLLLEYGGN
jgi:hypothetical protein